MSFLNFLRLPSTWCFECGYLKKITGKVIFKSGASPLLLNALECHFRVFLLTWPTPVQIYQNKRRHLHKKRVQLPQDWFNWDTNMATGVSLFDQHSLTSVKRPFNLRLDLVNVWHHARLVVYIYLWLMYASASIVYTLDLMFVSRSYILLFRSSLDWFKQEDVTVSF